jgi:CDP-glucose 4,6-dehydratase
MHFLITGHTGFKGAWLALLLSRQGHTVSGFSLAPVDGGLFKTANVSGVLKNDLRVDVRDASAVYRAVASVAPDVVIHLAAQALVRESYRDPRTTVETNVIGTMNVLEAIAHVPSVVASVVITTDKVYQNLHRVAGYVETDRLGGAADPYSASKAMADILTQSWIASFPGPATAIARAGNVIGGGDVSADRLLPDLLASFAAGAPARIRFPNSVRPWQHVLDCVNGYLYLVDALLDGSGRGAWNFGPGPESFVTVGHIADLSTQLWGAGASWSKDNGPHPDEAVLLALNSEKAERELNWHNRLRFPASLEWTVDWKKRVDRGETATSVTKDQIDRFVTLGT